LAAGLRLSELARQARVERACLTNYELHNVNPKARNLARLVGVLGAQLLSASQKGRLRRT
jgi:predicted transcriptional regulator